MLVCFFECIMLKVFRERKVFFLSILSSFILVLIDQITKNIAFISVNDLLQKTNGIHGHFSIFPFLNIVLIFNKGISFGLFNNSHVMPTLLTFVITAIIAYVFHLLYKNKSLYKSVYLSMILGGAVGNVIDRFKYGAVVDFIDFHISDWHFPAFNFADTVISLSVLLIIIESLMAE